MSDVVQPEQYKHVNKAQTLLVRFVVDLL